MRRTIIYILWGLLLAGLLAAFCIFTCINKGWVGYVPPVEELENPDYKFASQIISADGTQQALHVDARMVGKPMVLGGDERLHEAGSQLVVVNPHAVLAAVAEGSQLNAIGRDNLRGKLIFRILQVLHRGHKANPTLVNGTENTDSSQQSASQQYP